MLNIVYVTSAPIPSIAANSVHVMKMANAFALNGHDVVLMGARGDEKVLSSDIYTHYGVEKSFAIQTFDPFFKPLGRLLFPFIVVWTAYKRGADLVYCRCVLSFFLVSLLGKNTMMELHQTVDAMRPVTRTLFKLGLKGAGFHGLVVISDALKKLVLQQVNVSADNVLVLHDGADEIIAGASAPLKNQQDYLYRAGYVGHLYAGRGIDIVIDMARNAPSVMFHIIGGTQIDVEYWRAQCNTLKNIYFYGHVPPYEAQKYISSMDVLLAPYQKKVSVHGNGGDTSAWMSPLKIFEYMASGKPMICSDMPVLREVLTPDQTAMLCAPDDVDVWCDALRTLIENPDRAQKIASEAKKEFLEKYTWRARASRIVDYYNTRRDAKCL